LLNRFLFLRLSDIAHALPPYEEVVHPLTLPSEIAERYDILERGAIAWAREHGGGGIARFLQALLGYPDQPWDGETLTATMLDQSGTKQRCVVPAVPGLDPTQRTPKDRAGALRKPSCQDLDQGGGIPPGAEATDGQAARACSLTFEQLQGHAAYPR
jgi:hypothetical protein